MIRQIKERRVIVAMASIAVLVLFAACDGAGAGGGGGGGGGGGSAVTCESAGPGSGNITLMASGLYANDPDSLEFSIQYSWIDLNGGSQSYAVFEDEISLPWTTERNLDAGTGVSINIIGQKSPGHSNSMTLSICEDGNLVAKHVINEVVSDGELQPPMSGGGAGLTHVVGQ